MAVARRYFGDSKVFKERFGAANQDNVVEFLAFDPENPNSIHSCLRAARENARSVRDTISSEMWEQVNGHVPGYPRPESAA